MAGVEISIKVNGVAKVQGKLTRLAQKLGDLTVPNRAVATQLYSWFIDNFDHDGSLVGGWVPLAPATIRQKDRLGKEKMLVRSGHLRASVLPFSDAARAGIGSELSYSQTHQLGSSTVPQREILPRDKDVLDIGLRVYQLYVDRATREANK